MAAVDALWVLVPTGQRASGEWIDDTLSERVRERGLLARTPPPRRGRGVNPGVGRFRCPQVGSLACSLAP